MSTTRVPQFNSTVAAPVFIGANDLPAVRLLAEGVDATLQLITVGPDGALFGVFGDTGEPVAVFRMMGLDPLRNMAHMFARVLAGFTEPEQCQHTGQLARNFPEADWAGAADAVLRGIASAEDGQLDLFERPEQPPLLCPETGVAFRDCIERIELVSVVDYEVDDAAEPAAE